MVLILTVVNQLKTLNRAKKLKAVPFAAVGTAGHQHRLKVYTVCGIFVSVLKNDRALLNLSALN
jgi:hypothetical protein